MSGRFLDHTKNLKQPASLLVGGVLVSAVLGSCGVNPFTATQAQTACTSTQAQILVGDGFTQRLCGCGEGASGAIVRGNATNCTVSIGTSVFFIYQNFLPHQIIPATGTPNSFTPMKPSDPTHDQTPTKVFVIPSVAAGAYKFQDQFDSIFGTITAI